jgi:tRNA uridine 5-carboxymethylaminomethyl modification enzyme
VGALLAKKNPSLPEDSELAPWSRAKIAEEAEIESKYAGYIKRQRLTVQKFGRMEGRKIPRSFNYDAIPSLLTEAKQKFKKIRPETVGQASRIPGVTPSDIAILMIFLEKR